MNRFLVAVVAVVCAAASPLFAESLEAAAARAWSGPEAASSGLRLPDRPGAFSGASDAVIDLASRLEGPRAGKAGYPNGDAYFMIGDLTDSWAREEWQRFYHVTRRMLKNGYRVVLHPFPSVAQVRAAIQNPQTSVFIWSGHGSERGSIYSKNTPLPRDIFTEGASPRLKYVVIGSCYGEAIEKHYAMPPGASLKHWIGETDTPQFFHFLDSDQFPPTKK